MRAFVFTDPALARHAGRYVWLDIDTEKEKNAAFCRQFPIPALPTFLVVDPADERIVFRQTGGVTVVQLDRVLDDARVAFLREGSGFEASLARADALYGEPRYGEAADAYAEVLAAAPEPWTAYGRVAEARLFALSQADRDEECARAAVAALPRVRGQPSWLGLSAVGLDCALQMPKAHAGRDSLIAVLEPIVRDAVEDTRFTIAADDRSGAYISLLDARQQAGDSAGAHAVAERWAAFLDREAARATTPQQRTVFDSHRLSAYLELGRPERAIPLLEASARDFPDDYNPHARLAVAYQALERWQEALAEADRALALAYGPRKLRIYRTRADVQAAAGDSAAARATLAGAIGFAEALPEGQRSESSIRSLQAALDQLK